MCHKKLKRLIGQLSFFFVISVTTAIQVNDPSKFDKI